MMERERLLDLIDNLWCYIDGDPAAPSYDELRAAVAEVLADEPPRTLKHPWLVVDTWGDQTPVGCWFEQTAKSLARRLGGAHESGRWQAQPNPQPEGARDDRTS